KVYFPRLIVPLAAVGAGLVDFLIAFAILIGMMFWYGVYPGWGILLLPVVACFIILAAMALGSLLAGLTVAYRDFQYVVPFMTQLWMFITPVIYPSSIVPHKWRWLLSLNPMAGLIDGLRAAFLGRALDWPSLGLSMLVSLFLFLAGAASFP